MISLANPQSQVKITGKRVYFISKQDTSDFHDEVGFYVDLEYSDGSYDTFGPYDNKYEANSI
jgi:hypothetical protein